MKLSHDMCGSLELMRTLGAKRAGSISCKIPCVSRHSIRVKTCCQTVGQDAGHVRLRPDLESHNMPLP